MGQLVAGSLSDARGRRPILLGGLALFTVASLLCALAPSIWVLLAGRFVQGCAGAAGIVASRAVVRDRVAGAELARYLTLLMLVNGMAPIVAPIVGGQVLLLGDWRGCFILLTALGVVLLAAGARWLPESLAVADRQTGGVRGHAGEMRAALAQRSFVCFALASGLATGAMFAYIAGSPFVLQDRYGVSPQLYSVIFAANAGAIVLGGLVNRRLLRTHAPASVLAWGTSVQLVAAAVLAVVVATGGGVAGILVSLWVVVGCIGVVQPNAVALALEGHPRSAGSAAALVGLLQYGFGALVSPLVGVAGHESAGPMVVLIAVLCAAATVAGRVGARGG